MADPMLSNEDFRRLFLGDDAKNDCAEEARVLARMGNLEAQAATATKRGKGAAAVNRDAGGTSTNGVDSPPQPWKPSRPPQAASQEPRMAGGAVQGIVVPRARAAKAKEADQAAATGRSSRVISEKDLAMISQTTDYMTQEEAARYVEEVLAMHTPQSPYKTREERARDKQERTRDKQKLKAQASTGALWVRFIKKSPYAVVKIGDRVQIVGMSKSGKALCIANGGTCALNEMSIVWEYCEPPVS